MRPAPTRGAPAESGSDPAPPSTTDTPAEIATFVVHGMQHVRAGLAAAAESGFPVRLLFPFSFAASLGPHVAREVVAHAQAEMPGQPIAWVLDCADEAGLALSALRAGVPVVRFGSRGPAAAALADIARQLGGTLEPPSVGPILDLARCRDPLAACRNWLAERPARTESTTNATLPTAGGSCI